MIIELMILGGGALCGSTGLGKMITGHVPRPIYSALVGWWWGSFAEDSPGAMMASMIESDLNCDVWSVRTDSYYNTFHESYRKYDIIESENLHTRVEFNPRRSRCEMWLQDKKGKWHKHEVTAYEDYLLTDAKDRWKKRRIQNEANRVAKEHMDLVNERINQNYKDMLTMIEQRILNSDTTVTDPNLRALSPAPEQPVPVPTGGGKEPEYELVDDGFRTYRRPIEKKARKKSGIQEVWH